MRVTAGHGFAELVHDVLGRGLIRVAHPEIDDVFAAPTRLGSQVANDAEYIWGKARDALKLFSHGKMSASRLSLVGSNG